MKTGYNNLTVNIARIVSFCRTSKKRDQIMRELNFNELEIEAYTSILIRQRLLEENLEEYRTTFQGNSYLDTRDKVEVALRK